MIRDYQLLVESRVICQSTNERDEGREPLVILAKSPWRNKASHITSAGSEIFRSDDSATWPQVTAADVSEIEIDETIFSLAHQGRVVEFEDEETTAASQAARR